MFFEGKKTIPRAKMVKRNDKTNTGEGGKGKKSRTVPGSTCHLLRLLRGSSLSLVGLVQTDLRGSLLDTTMIHLMWSKQAP
jgi:hypothetical protein